MLYNDMVRKYAVCWRDGGGGGGAFVCVLCRFVSNVCEVSKLCTYMYVFLVRVQRFM